jgi:hypothetical protein
MHRMPDERSRTTASRSILGVIGLTDALSEIVVPAVRAVFNDGEVSVLSVQFDPGLCGGSITLALIAAGELFSDLVVQGDVDGHSVGDWRERLRSDMADLVAESRFTWGQNRGV